MKVLLHFSDLHFISVMFTPSQHVSITDNKWLHILKTPLLFFPSFVAQLRCGVSQTCWDCLANKQHSCVWASGWMCKFDIFFFVADLSEQEPWLDMSWWRNHVSGWINYWPSWYTQQFDKLKSFSFLWESEHFLNDKQPVSFWGIV